MPLVFSVATTEYSSAVNRAPVSPSEPNESRLPMTVGRYEDIDAEDARLKAAAMIDRIRRGRDPVPPPAPEEPTVADLAERFMAAHVAVNCKPGTVKNYRSLLRLCILPDLGDLRPSLNSGFRKYL